MHPIGCCCEICTAVIDELLAEPEGLETIITDTGDVVEIDSRPRTWYWEGSAHISRW